ncbi:transcriptional activator protein acu-15 [Penicillium angulare]|uniref:Transcriptional activator protein acu-15 n=1 Tax=Penicillium angulare TaxID=116970 RepID=A0A9W9KBS3_9EURO|nr:transcriptional activator protein acu-15 [Penicillium angulare]
MENAAAVMLGRPISLPDEEVDVEYPDIIDDWSSTEGALASLTKPTVAMSMAVHGFRYRRLLGRIHTSLYSKRALADVTGNSAAVSIELLRTELETWKASTPSLVPLSGQALSFFTTKDGFDTDYYYAILLLYRVQIIKSNEASRSAFFNCLQAAENILHAYRDQFIGRPTCYTWVALYEIILAGLTYLHCIWTSPDIRQTTRPDQVSSVCTDCTVVLVVMAEKWAAAAPYRDIFEALANRTMTMITDARYGESGLPSVFTESVDPDVETLMQWRTDIPHTGISDEIDSLLACLVGDQPSGMQAGNNEESYDGDHLRNSHIWN